jgi:hypothetical protein
MLRKPLLLSAFVLLAAIHLQAQATRTWVSGVGDDVNPCSRTAPCKTFAGAISKTAAGGEIDALDPGGFGTLTITKSLTIDGSGTLASVLGSNTNGIVINAGPTDVVILRGLSINGAVTTPGTDTRGIKFLAGLTLVVENCEVMNFGKRNISIESSTNGAQAFISNTNVHAGLVNGIIVSPPAGIGNQAVLDRVTIASNLFYGIGANPGSSVQIHNSIISNNAGGGVLTSGGAISIDSSLISGSPIGIEAQGGGVVKISDVTVVANATGLDAPSGTIVSFGDNRISGNVGGNGPPSSTISKQ